MCIINPMDGVPEWTRGDRLRKSREFAGYSIQEMADLLGYHRNTITAYESDERPIRPGTVRAWADLCGVDLEWLDGEREQVKSDSPWNSFTGSQDPLPFDDSDEMLVIDLRDNRPLAMAG